MFTTSIGSAPANIMRTQGVSSHSVWFRVKWPLSFQIPLRFWSVTLAATAPGSEARMELWVATAPLTAALAWYCAIADPPKAASAARVTARRDAFTTATISDVIQEISPSRRNPVFLTDRLAQNCEQEAAHRLWCPKCRLEKRKRSRLPKRKSRALSARFQPRRCGGVGEEALPLPGRLRP